jgi:hypothetical protein
MNIKFYPSPCELREEPEITEEIEKALVGLMKIPGVNPEEVKNSIKNFRYLREKKHLNDTKQLYEN